MQMSKPFSITFLKIENKSTLMKPKKKYIRGKINELMENAMRTNKAI